MNTAKNFIFGSIYMRTGSPPRCVTLSPKIVGIAFAASAMPSSTMTRLKTPRARKLKMPSEIPFRLSLTGDTSDRHYFQGYDGYLALAGFAWTLSLVSNYVETGKIRHRGDFPGRHSVRASAIAPGSVTSDFNVWIQNNPALALVLSAGLSVPTSMVANLLYGMVKHVIARNLGQRSEVGDSVNEVIRQRGGDVEALVAANEASIRQTHGVIGSGANVIQIFGGSQIINTYNHATREYVMQNVEDREILQRDFSVAAFNANSGYGSVFDFELGRTIPFSMKKRK